MQECKPEMQKCARCDKWDACERSPYLGKDREIDAWAWIAYNQLRANLATLDKKQYEALYEMLQPGTEEHFIRMGMTRKEAKQISRRIRRDSPEKWIMGLERVHRMLLKLVEDGTVRVLEEPKGGQEAP